MSIDVLQKSNPIKFRVFEYDESTIDLMFENIYKRKGIAIEELSKTLFLEQSHKVIYFFTLSNAERKRYRISSERIYEMMEYTLKKGIVYIGYRERTWYYAKKLGTLTQKTTRLQNCRHRRLLP